MSTASHPLDLSSYFQRIGFAEKAAPTLACLKQLHRLHQENIPFENLDALLDQPISIELATVFSKLVANKRGGYCFEQNTLFAAVLRKIGFQVAPYIARVRWMVPDEIVTPLSHMTLRVETEAGPHLADVGFGGVGLVEPIALESRATQHTRFEPRRIVERHGQLVHQIQIGHDWKDVYQFEPQAVAPIDLEVGNWYSHTHPQARFRNSLLVAKLTPSGRIVIADTEFIQRDWHGQARRSDITTHPQLHQILREHFGLTLPAHAEVPYSFPATT